MNRSTAIVMCVLTLFLSGCQGPLLANQGNQVSVGLENNHSNNHNVSGYLFEAPVENVTFRVTNDSGIRKSINPFSLSYKIRGGFNDGITYTNVTLESGDPLTELHGSAAPNETVETTTDYTHEGRVTLVGIVTTNSGEVVGISIMRCSGNSVAIQFVYSTQVGDPDLAGYHASCSRD